MNLPERPGRRARGALSLLLVIILAVVVLPIGAVAWQLRRVHVALGARRRHSRAGPGVAASGAVTERSILSRHPTEIEGPAQRVRSRVARRQGREPPAVLDQRQNRRRIVAVVIDDAFPRER